MFVTGSKYAGASVLESLIFRSPSMYIFEITFPVIEL